MSEVRHTPEPWVLENGDEAWYIKADRDIIAVIPRATDAKYDEVVGANARLMTVAPSQPVGLRLKPVEYVDLPNLFEIGRHGLLRNRMECSVAKTLRRNGRILGRVGRKARLLCRQPRLDLRIEMPERREPIDVLRSGLPGGQKRQPQE